MFHSDGDRGDPWKTPLSRIVYWQLFPSSFISDTLFGSNIARLVRALPDLIPCRKLNGAHKSANFWRIFFLEARSKAAVRSTNPIDKVAPLCWRRTSCVVVSVSMHPVSVRNPNVKPPIASSVT